MEKKRTAAKKTAKSSEKKTAKAGPKKPSIKTAKKKIAVKAQKKEIKKPLKKTKAAKPVKKRLRAEREIEKAVKKISKEVPLAKTKVAKVPVRTLRKVSEHAEVFKAAVGKEKAASRKLPSGYGENRITLMVVDPWKLFAYWEVRKDALTGLVGEFVLRVYDITGIDFTGGNANVVFDIPVFDRAGDSYIGAGPGRAFIVDIGIILLTGDFVAIARSNKVATPDVKAALKEGVLTQEAIGTSPAMGFF